MRQFFWFLLIFVDISCISGIRIGAFNAKTLGKTKLSKPVVVDYLIKIISRYDLIVLQELRDVSGVAIQDLLEQVNVNSTDEYAMILGARAGRSTYKEQYVFMYKESVMNATDHYDYPDPKDDFEREPLVARFQISTKCSGNPVLAVAGFHAKPDRALYELDKLVDVYEDIVNKWKIKDVAIIGDFNADCSYVREYEWDNIRLRNDTSFHWLIPDDADTTVNPNTDCAYDRLVVTENLASKIYSPSVFKFDSHYELSPDMALEISDHYPVEMFLRTSTKCPRSGNQSVHSNKNHVWFLISAAFCLTSLFCQ